MRGRRQQMAAAAAPSAARRSAAGRGAGGGREGRGRAPRARWAEDKCLAGCGAAILDEERSERRRAGREPGGDRRQRVTQVGAVPESGRGCGRQRGGNGRRFSPFSSAFPSAVLAPGEAPAAPSGGSARRETSAERGSRSPPDRGGRRKERGPGRLRTCRSSRSPSRSDRPVSAVGASVPAAGPPCAPRGPGGGSRLGRRGGCAAARPGPGVTAARPGRGGSGVSRLSPVSASAEPATRSRLPLWGWRRWGGRGACAADPRLRAPAGPGPVLWHLAGRLAAAEGCPAATALARPPQASAGLLAALSPPALPAGTRSPCCSCDPWL